MSEIRKKLILKILVGFVCGIAVGAFFLIGAGKIDSYLQNPGKMFRACICCGLYGAACIGGTILYRIEQISILKATVIHYLLVIVGLFLLGLSFNWDYSNIGVWSIFIAYTFGFYLSWNIMYLIGRRRARMMNRDLMIWKESLEKPEQKNKARID